jgi:hypothetical protein
METLRQKFGPLPVWGWLALVTAILLGYWLYEQHKNASTASSDLTSSGTAGGSYGNPLAEPGMTATVDTLEGEIGQDARANARQSTQIKNLEAGNKRQQGQINKLLGRKSKKPAPRKGKTATRSKPATHPASAHPAKRSAAVSSRTASPPEKSDTANAADNADAQTARKGTDKRETAGRK